MLWEPEKDSYNAGHHQVSPTFLKVLLNTSEAYLTA